MIFRSEERETLDGQRWLSYKILQDFLQIMFILQDLSLIELMMKKGLNDTYIIFRRRVIKEVFLSFPTLYSVFES